MSHFKTKGALGALELKGFGGIDRKTPINKNVCASLVKNFRVLPDGSLKKRCGYKFLTSFMNAIRAVYTGYIDGRFEVYVLSGDLLYKYDMNIGRQTLMKQIGTTSGKASFFYYYGHLYLLDGAEIYDIVGQTVTVAKGYIPLYGKDWRDSYAGEVNEPLNLLTPKARISYIIGDPPTAFLDTVYTVSSVDAVYVNGELISSDRYRIDDEFKTVNVRDLSAGDRVLMYLTFDSSAVDRSSLAKNTCATVFGGIFNSRVFMWGGERGDVMFSSRHVSEDAYKASEAVLAGSGSLYFPADHEFSVGDGRYAISAVSRHYDRLLIFTEGEGWMADSEASGLEEFPVMRINAERGCLSAGGCAKCENDPITVSDGAILRWTSNTDELEDCNAYSISDGISDLLSENFFKNAVVYADKARREIYFTDSTAVGSRIIVYGTENRQWYIYNDVSADIFFDMDGEVAFVNDREIYIFDDSLCQDILPDGNIRSIDALYTVENIDFGYRSRTKRLKGVELVGDLSEQEITLEFESDAGVHTAHSFVGDGSGKIRSHSARLNSDRFVRTSMTLRCEGDMPQRIYSMTVTAKE